MKPMWMQSAPLWTRFSQGPGHKTACPVSVPEVVACPFGNEASQAGAWLLFHTNAGLCYSRLFPRNFAG